MDAGDVASQAVDLRRGHPEGVVPRRAADGREDGRPRPVEFPQPRLDLRKLVPGSGVPRLDRLRSHLQQFAKLLDGAGELGKKLDFLLQEMHREANTMLSKTPGVETEALAITGLSLEIRAEIEKLREQVQNIE